MPGYTFAAVLLRHGEPWYPPRLRWVLAIEITGPGGFHMRNAVRLWNGADQLPSSNLVTMRNKLADWAEWFFAGPEEPVLRMHRRMVLSQIRKRGTPAIEAVAA